MPEKSDILKRTMLQTSNCWKQFPAFTDDDFIADFVQCLYWRNLGNTPEDELNQFLNRFEMPLAQIVDTLTNRFPLFTGAQSLIIKRICQSAAQHNHITLLDLGCGRGEQLVKILNALNSVARLQSVTVIGTALQTGTLNFCKTYIHSRRSEYHYKLEFKSIPAPLTELSAVQLQSMLPDEHSALMINASMVLHQVQQPEQRQWLFSLLHSLQPVLFTMIEANTDTTINQFEERMLNTWQHVGNIYKYIGQAVTNRSEQTCLKRFFRKTLYELLVVPDYKRSKNYSPATYWLELAQETGFYPVPLSKPDPSPAFPGITAEYKANGYFSFSFDGTEQLSAMAFSVD